MPDQSLFGDDQPKYSVRCRSYDGVKSAEAANLVHVNDHQPGIVRIRRGDKFLYRRNGRQVKDAATLQRISQLAIPPVWRQVWICAKVNGHLQATGIDRMGRKQYKYHPRWNTFRTITKFHRLLSFGEALPLLRQQLQKALSLPGMPIAKVLATILCLMDETHIRVGNGFYENQYGSFGLTTLKDKHVEVRGSKIRFCFIGKKGIPHKVTLRNQRLARLVRKCIEIPGKELFQYLDENGEPKAVDSGMVNDYLKRISQGDFTTKDFRTWSGTYLALKVLLAYEPKRDRLSMKKDLLEMLDTVASCLGNTRAVCRKHYIHPVIPMLFIRQKLREFIPRKHSADSFLCVEEQALIRILKKAASTRWSGWPEL